MAELVFFRRGEEVLRFALGVGRVVLGRGDRADVVVPDPEVSRQHVAITVEADGASTFEDLTGKGALVGGQRLKAGALADGTDVALGQWRAIFRARGSAEEVGATELGERTELTPRAGEGTRLSAQVRVRTAEKEQVHKLQQESFTVGKDSGNDLVLTQRFISGRHVKISRQENRFHVLDNHSTNGTWLGTTRLFDAEVPFFTVLKLGEVELTLEPLGIGAARTVTSYQGIIGNDPSVRALAEMIERVAPSMAAVTVLGESGTGKELVARAVHTRSTRAEGAFIPVNCAAISKELIESELFGHEKGAFTGAASAHKGAFEEADGGTIFLDEVGELPLELQAKLLRVLESGEIKRVGAARPSMVDVRIVAATNRDLLRRAREGKFREDLYYRLCVVPLTLPPLRNRKTDLLVLADHFLKAFAPRGQTVRLSAAAVQKLERHAWPGNIRELRNVVHRALLLRRGANIEADDITFDAPLSAEAPASDDALQGVDTEAQPGQTLEQMLARCERQIIESALRRCDNNRERVARELGMARSTLFKRLREWNGGGASGAEEQ
jgi:DNA-binding NtrC family response regulator/pSer/pThr/pTyr-binding forkhead associated (FHA) protein